MVATPSVGSRCQSRVIEPRNSSTAEAFAVGSAGAASTKPLTRRGVVGSAGVVERGKGTGWIARKPGRSRSRPRASEPAVRVAGRTMTLAWKVPPTYRERKLRDTNKEERVDLGSESNK